MALLPSPRIPHVPTTEVLIQKKVLGIRSVPHSVHFSKKTSPPSLGVGVVGILPTKKATREPIPGEAVSAIISSMGASKEMCGVEWGGDEGLYKVTSA